LADFHDLPLSFLACNNAAEGDHEHLHKYATIRPEPLPPPLAHPDPEKETVHMSIKILRKFGIASTGVAMLLTATVRVAEAQERPAPVVEFAAGSLLFPDDGIVSEGFAGVAARAYLSPRISIGPEIAFIQGGHHSHLMVTGNLTCDLLAPLSGRPRRVTPFVVVGGGMFQTSENFPTGNFTSTEGAFTAGGGVRALLGDRVTAGIESRVGWETHIRVNGFVGVRLGR
jgi:hypothetical protein